MQRMIRVIRVRFITTEVEITVRTVAELSALANDDVNTWLNGGSVSGLPSNILLVFEEITPAEYAARVAVMDS